MKLGLHLTVPPSGQSYGLKPDRPLSRPEQWIQIRVGGKWQTHAIMKGTTASAALCGLSLPLHARTGNREQGCEACRAKVPLLTPNMEAEWWSKYG